MKTKKKEDPYAIFEESHRIERSAFKAVAKTLKTIRSAKLAIDHHVTPWQPIVQFHRSIRYGGQHILLAVGQSPQCSWIAYAVTTDVNLAERERERGAVQIMEAVFEQHGHKVIGEYKSQERAMGAADTYAKKWIRGRAKIDRCGCKEIDLPKKKRKRP